MGLVCGENRYAYPWNIDADCRRNLSAAFLWLVRRLLHRLMLPGGHGVAQVVEEHAAHEMKVHLLLENVRKAFLFPSKPRGFGAGMGDHKKHSGTAASLVLDDQASHGLSEIVDLGGRDGTVTDA